MTLGKLSLVVAGVGAQLLGVGCGAKPPPDPNDPKEVGILQPEVLQRNLRWASDMVNERVAKEEITEEEGKQYLAKYAAGLIDKVDFKLMKPAQAWQYADVFRTAKRWDLAKKALEMSVEHFMKANNQDRRVNDSLRLAQAQGELGEHKLAIETTRSVFDAPEQDKAPILLAVVYEIAPAVRGRGLDVELAQLVEDAIGQHKKVVVDSSSDEGQAFLAAKWHHIRKAWDLAIELYRVAGREDLANQARNRAMESMDDQGRL